MLLFISLTLPILLGADCISIHLMLLFIQIRDKMNASPFGFQYISCYCLSLLLCYHPLLLFAFQYISCYCLSDKRQGILIWYDGFQYISCYCLSFFVFLSFCYDALFQYISCYCLSFNRYQWRWYLCISIHLMLLFILCAHICHSQFLYFNTSHVTVYHHTLPNRNINHNISIHLMLLFIGLKYNHQILSNLISIHLMLLFIAFVV